MCSHPREEESYEEAVHRRLQEEMGFDCEVKEQFPFIYKATFDNGLTEYEFDRVFVGYYDGEVVPNPEEVCGVRWVGLENLRSEMEEQSDLFTPWCKMIVEKLSAIS